MTFNDLTAHKLWDNPYANDANKRMRDLLCLHDKIGGNYLQHSPLEVLTVAVVLERFFENLREGRFTYNLLILSSYHAHCQLLCDFSEIA